MSSIQKGMRPFHICSSCSRRLFRGTTCTVLSYRQFSTSPLRTAGPELQQINSVQPPKQSVTASLDGQPEAETPPETLELVRGSKRRRAAIRTSPNIPFERLPYQCFQEALKVLKEDRAEKVAQIEEYKARIVREVEKRNAVEAQVTDEVEKRIVAHLGRNRLKRMQKHLTWLKVQADINDPTVKRRFEDGLGDMSKPVYRHLQDRRWRSYERKIVEQRLHQMHVIPDVLPTFNPIVQLNLRFLGKKFHHGDIVASNKSETPPNVLLQVFDAGERLVTIAIVDSDVPNVEKDGFDYRCHGLYTNIPISPTAGLVSLSKLQREDSSNVVVPWLPPHCQKGAPYHRLSVWVLEQEESKILDAQAVRNWLKTKPFTLRAFSNKFRSQPVGGTMFRTVWDEWTVSVMEKHCIKAANIEYRKKPIEPMPYKKKDGERFR